MKKFLLLAILIMAFSLSFAVLNVSVSSDTPASQDVYFGQNVDFLHIKMSSQVENIVINQIILNEFSSGLFPNGMLSNVTMFVDDILYSDSSQPNDLGEVYLDNCNLFIPGNGNVVNIRFCADITYTGNIDVGFKIQSQNITGITDDGNLAIVYGDFPIYGNLMTIVGPESVALNVELSENSPASQVVYPGLVEMFKFNLTAQNEDIMFFNLSLWVEGLCNREAIEYASIYADGSLIQTSILFLNRIDFGSGNFNRIIHVGETVEFTVSLYVNQSIINNSTIQVGIVDPSDMNGYGVNSNIVSQVNGEFPIFGSLMTFQNRSSWLDVYSPENAITIWSGNDASTTQTKYLVPGQIGYGYARLNAQESIVGLTYEEFHDTGLFMNLTETNQFSEPGDFAYSNTNTSNRLSWIANSSGVFSEGLVWFWFQNLSGYQDKYISHNLQVNYMYYDGFYNWPATSHFSWNVTLVTNDGVRGDFNGDGVTDHEDVTLLQNSFLNNQNLDTEYNPSGEVNIARTRFLYPYDNYFHLILLNWFAHNTNAEYTTNLHIGENFTFEAQQNMPVSWEQSGNAFTINTNANSLGIFWTNLDGTNGSQVMLFDTNQCRIWTNSDQPEIVQNNRTAVTFQLPEGATLKDILARQLDVATATSDQTTAPKIASLNNNYPNPFNPSTTISFSLPKVEKVELSIFNIKGQLVKTLVNEIKNAGSYNVTWNGKDSNNKSVSSGTYLYKINAGSFSETKKMILMK